MESLETSSVFPSPERVSPPLLPLQKTARGGTSLWSCSRVGCAQDVTKAINFKLGETGRNALTGLCPPWEKVRNYLVARGVYRMSAWSNVQGNGLSAAGKLCLASQVSRDSSGRCLRCCSHGSLAAISGGQLHPPE